VQDPARVCRSAESDLSQPAGRCRQQGDADDPVAEQLGMQIGERQHSHATHRMADQDDRATVACHPIDHPVEILAELVDGGPLRPAAYRTAVAALVEEDQPAEIGEITPLVMPGVLVEGVPVDKDDCEVCVGGPVQLDIEVHTVVGDHVHRLAAQATERLVSRSVRTAE
jgi:hypothetical protein